MFKGKRDRYLWYLYDFANSIALVVLVYYFSLWVVLDQGGSQWLVSVPLSLATLCLIFIMPPVGRSADRTGSHKKYMIAFSIAAVASLLGLAFYRQGFGLWLVFLLYFLFNFCFQAGYVFFASLLRSVSDENNRAKVSGLSQAWGQVGNLVGVLVASVALSGATFYIVGKQNAFLWSAIVFLILLIVIAIFGKFRVGGSAQGTEQAAVIDRRAFIAKLRAQPRVLRFLIAYVLYSDAMITVSFFGTLFMKQATGFSDGQIKIAAIVTIVATLLGGLVIGWLLRNRKEIKMIGQFLLLWPIVILCTAFATNTYLVLALFFLLGFGMSVIFVLSRSYYSTIIPPSEQAEYFSIYVVFERIGAVVGPLLWSLIIAVSFSLGTEMSYRIAFASLGVIAAIGAFIIRGLVKREQ